MPRDPYRSATQRENPHFRPLNLNASAMLTGSGDRQGEAERGKEARAGRGESGGLTVHADSPHPARRYLAAKNARQTAGPFTSLRGISHPCSGLFFPPPARSRVNSEIIRASIGRTCNHLCSLLSDGSQTSAGGERGTRQGEIETNSTHEN